MILPETLAEFRRNFEAGGPPFNAPAHIHEPMHRATDELIAAGAAGKVLKTGDKAPTFTLRDADGAVVSSSDLLSRGPLIVTFYRGVWCHYCNMDLQALEAALPKLKSLSAQLGAVSPQTAPNSRCSQRENKLGFPILCDQGNRVAEAFHLRFALPDYLRELYKSAFRNNLQVVNGDPSWTLPMAARYVIAQDGTILYAEANPDYTTRPDPEDLLPILKRASQMAA